MSLLKEHRWFPIAVESENFDDEKNVTNTATAMCIFILAYVRFLSFMSLLAYWYEVVSFFFLFVVMYSLKEKMSLWAFLSSIQKA